MTTLDYKKQSPEVSDRFERLKKRPVTLSVQHLGRVFASQAGPVEAIKDVSFDVHRREFICVIGPSGLWEIYADTNSRGARDSHLGARPPRR